MKEVFINAPIQNGKFEFDDADHKIVGMRLAVILNSLVDNEPTPHQWNLSRLAGDIEFAEYCRQTPLPYSRTEYEQSKIDRRYHASSMVQPPEISNPIATDASPTTVAAGHILIEEGLANGNLFIETVRTGACLDCGNHLNSTSKCQACGSDRVGNETVPKLFARRDIGQPLIVPDDTYANIKTSYISAMANHVPNPLPISKTRQLGISLEPFGLPGQVLDPRAGLHVASLANYEHVDDTQETMLNMLTTASVAIKSIAYGQYFRRLGSTRLNYALYGRVPYSDMKNDPAVRGSAELESQFRQWFLPLQALTTREIIPHPQILALRKFFGKVACSDVAISDAQDIVKDQIKKESLRWITDKGLLASVRPGHI